jgi:hypothetical protein
MEQTEKPIRKSKDANAKKVQSANEEMREHRKKFALVSDGKGGVKQIER